MKQLLSLLIIFYSLCILYGAEVPVGKDFSSPDGRYAVHLAGNDDEHFVIEDKTTGAKDISIEMPTVLLFLRWSNNSKSFVTVEHIANGSYGRIVYLKDGRWISSSIEPPISGITSSSIVEISEANNSAYFTFVVKLEKSNGKELSYKVCTVEVSLDSGKIASEKCKSISQKDAGVLLINEPKYFKCQRSSR